MRINVLYHEEGFEILSYNENSAAAVVAHTQDMIEINFNLITIKIFLPRVLFLK